jgi:hypothetical protein
MDSNNMKHPRDSTGLSLSPPRQRYNNRLSATRCTVGDAPACELANDAEKTAEDHVSVPAARESQHRRASMPVVQAAKGPTPACPSDPPRRRFARRCSATAYNLHSYTQQVQEQQGSLTR